MPGLPGARAGGVCGSIWALCGARRSQGGKTEARGADGPLAFLCPMMRRTSLGIFRSGPMALSGDSRRKQSPSRTPQGHGLGKTSMKRPAPRGGFIKASRQRVAQRATESLQGIDCDASVAFLLDYSLGKLRGRGQRAGGNQEITKPSTDLDENNHSDPCLGRSNHLIR
jgi:hypothetical protein